MSRSMSKGKRKGGGRGKVCAREQELIEVDNDPPPWPPPEDEIGRR